MDGFRLIEVDIATFAERQIALPLEYGRFASKQ